MKGITILNEHPKLGPILEAASADLGIMTRSYSRARALAESINHKDTTPHNTALIILTGTSREKDPDTYREKRNILTSLQGHSKFSSVPILFLGYNSCSDLEDECQSLGVHFMALPLKKSSLVSTIKRLAALSTPEEQAAPLAEKEKTSPQKTKKPARESERRLATVLFADISGFTAMSEKMDPEEVTAVMNSTFSMMEKIINDHGGHIDKFIGDCVMALFGVPQAIENAPGRAVNTALQLRETLYRNNKNLKIPLDIHIGINSGTVVAGTVGGSKRKDYTVMGDTVNLASRLESASETGQILVGPETWKQTRDYFRFNPLKPVSLKGKAEPVPVYELSGIHEGTAKKSRGSEPLTTSPGRMIESPLVGRQKEMNVLKLQVMKAVNSEGGIITIIGEAGIGKSRLMAELKSKDAVEEVTILEGRAVSMGRNLSFHPVIDLLKGWAGIDEDDTDTEALKKLEDTVGTVHPSGGGEIVPFVATMMGITLSGSYAERIEGIEGEALEKLIFKNVRDLLIKGSELKPMLIHIEDLHWADTSTLEMLEPLMRLAETCPIIFILVYRPGYEETGDRISTAIRENFKTGYHEINLSPLESEESEKLISNLLKIEGLPHSLREEIVSRAGGNPFFIEEVVRSLIDEEAVQLKNGNFTVTEKIHHVRIPATINEVLMARIDRLDDETRELIKTASVIGRSFFHKILAEVSTGIHNMDDRLTLLKEVQLIKDRTRMDELEYLFKHALAQETAYESLLIQKRKELHGRVARAIESIFSSRLHEFYGMLAWHFSQAEDMEKAEEYMLKAGEEAMKASASSEAITFFKQALDVFIKHSDKNIDNEKITAIEKNIAFSLIYKGSWDEAIYYFDRIIKRTEQKSLIKTPESIKIFISLANIYYRLFIRKKYSFKKPGKKLIQKWEILNERGRALIFMNPKLLFFENIKFLSESIKYDFANIQIGVEASLGAVSIFTWGGISTNITKNLLEHIEKNRTSHSKSIAFIELARHVVNFLTGNWNFVTSLEEAGEQIKTGNIFTGLNLLIFSTWCRIEKGNFSGTFKTIEGYLKVANEYSYEHSRGIYYEQYCIYKFKKREFKDLIHVIDEGCSFFESINQEMRMIQILSFKTTILIIQNNLTCAADTIETINLLIKKEQFLIPYYKGHAYITQSLFYLKNLKDSIDITDPKTWRTNKKNALTYIQKAISIGKKVASHHTESIRLKGTLHWLTGLAAEKRLLLFCWILPEAQKKRQHKKALSWWKRSIDRGEELGARLELSRTYFEIAKYTYALTAPPARPLPGGEGSSPKSFWRNLPSPSGREAGGEGMTKKIIGLTPEECLNKAEGMFTEMGLKWDLEQVRKLKGGKMLQK